MSQMPMSSGLKSEAIRAGEQNSVSLVRRSLTLKMLSYIKVVLPSSVAERGSEFAKLQERFEEILIKYGLLKDGIEAIGDELGRSVRENALVASEAMRGAAAQYTHENPPTDEPMKFSSTTHSITSSAAEHSGQSITRFGPTQS
jgi:hypothetical protein